MNAGSIICQPCPANTVTQPGVPAHTRAACVCAPGFQSLGQGTRCEGEHSIISKQMLLYVMINKSLFPLMLHCQ